MLTNVQKEKVFLEDFPSLGRHSLLGRVHERPLSVPDVLVLQSYIHAFLEYQILVNIDTKRHKGY